MQAWLPATARILRRECVQAAMSAPPRKPRSEELAHSFSEGTFGVRNSGELLAKSRDDQETEVHAAPESPPIGIGMPLESEVTARLLRENQSGAARLPRWIIDA
jgi:hypothetical protein